jgi:uncharacterized protein YndB with AHSA1/START domain
MKTVSVVQRIPVPAQAVWSVVRTGADMDRWFPPVTACRVEGEGVGARRLCVVNGHELLEAIETVDDDTRIFQYRILKQDMMPTRNMLGTFHVSAVTPVESQILWLINFDLDDEGAWPVIKESIEGMYQAGIAGLNAHVGKVAT